MLGHTKRFARRVLRSLGYEIVPTKAALPREVRNDYDAVLSRMGEYRFKFLDLKTFLTMTIARAHYLGLHKPPPLDVLDLGTGCGYFPFVCEFYGHRAIGINQKGNRVFEDVPEWLGIQRRYWEIEANEALPSFQQRFDLITAFMVTFDRFTDRDYAPWGVPEWDFFFRDLVENQLQTNGRLALLFNEHTLGVPQVIEFMRTKGGVQDGSWMVFPAGSLHQSFGPGAPRLVHPAAGLSAGTVHAKIVLSPDGKQEGIVDRA